MISPQEIDRQGRTLLVVIVLAMMGAVAIMPRAGHAEYDTIKQTDVGNIVHAAVITPGGSFTQARAFVSLHRTVTQTVQVQGTGTSPNYKVELLVMIDGTIGPGSATTGTFVKPEIGGDLGTFTDANAHVIPLFAPLCLASKLKFTELGASNSITVEAFEASQ